MQEGQPLLYKRIIAKIGGGERNKLEFRVGVGEISARGDELVCRVVLVRGDEECAAKAGTGFADRATECVFVAATPARRGEAGGAFDRF